jgi:tetratricopeptide (TPR) repeat protein
MRMLVCLTLTAVLSFPVWCAPATPLEEAVKAYNRLRDIEDDTQPSELTEADLAGMKAEFAGVQSNLERLGQGKDENARAARYFRANFLYEIGYVSQVLKHPKDTYENWSQAAADMVFLADSKNFPVVYPFEGRNRTIRAEDFSATLLDFYASMGKLCGELKRYEESITWLTRALDYPTSNVWVRYLASSGILNAKRELREMDESLAQRSLDQILLATKLRPDELQLVLSDKYPTAQLGYSTLKWVLQLHPEWDKGRNLYGQAATALARLGYSSAADEALKLSKGKK